MEGFVVGVFVVLVLWFFSWLGSQNKAVRAFNALDSVEDWFNERKINKDSVIFNTYEDPKLARNPGCVVLTGHEKRGDIGFVLEIEPKTGAVVDSRIIEPFGLVTWKSTAMEAKALGIPLMDMLIEKERQHRERYPKVKAKETASPPHQPSNGFTFSLSMPDFTKCQVERAFRIGDYGVFVVKNPKPVGESLGQAAMGIIEYLFALVVFSEDKEQPIKLMVTAERSGETLQKALRSSSSAIFLCAFDESGAHRTYGESQDCEDFDKFTTKALTLACEILGVEDQPEELTESKTPNQENGSGTGFSEEAVKGIKRLADAYVNTAMQIPTPEQIKKMIRKSGYKDLTEEQVRFGTSILNVVIVFWIMGKKIPYTEALKFFIAEVYQSFINRQEIRKVRIGSFIRKKSELEQIGRQLGPSDAPIRNREIDFSTLSDMVLNIRHKNYVDLLELGLAPDLPIVFSPYSLVAIEVTSDITGEDKNNPNDSFMDIATAIDGCLMAFGKGMHENIKAPSELSS